MVAQSMPRCPFAGQIRRLEHGNWGAGEKIGTNENDTQLPALEPYFSQVAPEPSAEQAVLTPSALDQVKALPGRGGLSEDDAKAYGSLVHWYLEQEAGTPPEESRMLPEDPAQFCQTGGPNSAVFSIPQIHIRQYPRRGHCVRTGACRPHSRPTSTD